MARGGRRWSGSGGDCAVLLLKVFIGGPGTCLNTLQRYTSTEQTGDPLGPGPGGHDGPPAGDGTAPKGVAEAVIGVPARLAARPATDPPGPAAGTEPWPGIARECLKVQPQAVLRRLPGRETFARTVELPGDEARSPGTGASQAVRRRVIVKRFATRRGCPARDEFATLEALREAGVAVPEPLAWAAAGRLSALLMADLALAPPGNGSAGEPLDGTGQAAGSEMGSGQDLGWHLARADGPGRRRLLAALLDLLGQFHGDLGQGPGCQSWYHRDLYLSHILVGHHGRLTMIDVGRVRPCVAPERARRWFAKDLAALLHSAPPEVSRSERLRFLAAWLERTGRSAAGDQHRRRRQLRSWARDVMRRRRAMAAHRPRHGEAGPYAGAQPAAGKPASTKAGGLPELVVRMPNWIGDAVMAEPLIAALAAAHGAPESAGSLTLLGSAPVLSLFRHLGPKVELRPLAGRETAAHYVGASDSVGAPGAAGSMESGGAIDPGGQKSGQRAALFLNGSLRSVLAARLAGIRSTWGWADGGRRFLLSHAVERQLGRGLGQSVEPMPLTAAAAMLGQALGLDYPARAPRLTPQPAARSAVEKRLGQAGLDPVAPFILLNAGGRRGSAKAWPAAYWGELLDLLAREQTLPLVLTAGPGEEESVRAAIHAAGAIPDGRVLLCLDPVPDLPELLALSAAAVLVVGTDSGPAHLARAAGRPTVVVMGPTDPRHSSWPREREHSPVCPAQSGPFRAGPPTSAKGTAPRVVVRAELPCGPCHRERCPLAGDEFQRCMSAVSPAMVAAAARELIELQSPGQSAAAQPTACESPGPGTEQSPGEGADTSACPLGLTGAGGVGSYP